MNLKCLRRFSATATLMAALCTAAHGAAIGLHAGQDGSTSQYDDFGTWLGKPVMYRVTFADDSSWSSIASPYFLGTSTKAWLASNPGRFEVVTIPLEPKTGDTAMLADVAAGKYDSDFRQLAQNLSTKTGAPQRIIVRLGWELNGNWYPWSAINAPATYAAAYRHVVQTMRSVCNVLRFEWNLSRTGTATFDWTQAYPGDDVVDIVSMDVYDEYVGDWNDVMSGPEGLTAFRKFAQAHNKSEAYTEWSLSTQAAGHGDDTAFIQGMYNWIIAGGSNVLYAGYWDTASGGPNAVIYGPGSGLVPNSAALYKKLFGQ